MTGIMMSSSMSGSPTLADLYDRLTAFAGLKESVTLSNVDHFLRLASHFKEEITLHTPPNSTEPPYRLPTYIHNLFSACLSLDNLAIIQLWGAFKHLVWTTNGSSFNPLSQAELQEVDVHGMKEDGRKSEQLCE